MKPEGSFPSIFGDFNEKSIDPFRFLFWWFAFIGVLVVIGSLR